VRHDRRVHHRNPMAVLLNDQNPVLGFTGMPLERLVVSSAPRSAQA